MILHVEISPALIQQRLAENSPSTCLRATGICYTCPGWPRAKEEPQGPGMGRVSVPGPASCRYLDPEAGTARCRGGPSLLTMPRLLSHLGVESRTCGSPAKCTSSEPHLQAFLNLILFRERVFLNLCSALQSSCLSLPNSQNHSLHHHTQVVLKLLFVT